MKKAIKIIAGVLGAVIAVGAIVAGIYFLTTDKGPFSGTVTENGNPVAGVSVTDGYNVVKTDEKGSFELDGWRKSRFVAITVPSGYQTDAFYIPVEKNTESYDFTLEKSDLTAQENHCFLQISDTEIGEQGTGEWLDAIKDIIKEQNPAFLIHTGDICYEDGLKRHIKDMNTETMGRTVRYTIGNHDYVQGDYGEALYESIYGPTWYSFDVGETHYVVTPFKGWSDYKSDYSDSACWKWLKNDLENVDPDKKVVMFNHTKCESDDYVVSLGTAGKLDLKEHNLVAWIYGHYHYNYVDENYGVVNISAPRPDSGGIDSSPAGTRVINMNANGIVNTEMVYYDLNASSEPQNTVWQTKLDGNVMFCDTVSDGEYIYTATAADDYPHQCGIYCINQQSGEIVWYYESVNSVKNNICLYNDSVIVMESNGNVYSLDKVNGNVVWTSSVPLGSYTVGTSSGICVDDGIVYAGVPRIVTALSASDGEILWSINRDSGENSPAEFVVSGNKLLVSSHWDSLSALDKTTGKELWANKDEDLRFRSSTPIAVDDKTILAADSNAVMLIDAESGVLTDRIVLEDYSFSSSAQPVINDGIAYIPTVNKGIIAFSLDSKQVLWNFETGENILFTAPYSGKGSKTVESTPVFDNGNLIFGANDGFVYTVNAQSGELISSQFVGSAVLGKVVVTGSNIYAGTFDGYIVCISK